MTDLVFIFLGALIMLIGIVVGVALVGGPVKRDDSDA